MLNTVVVSAPAKINLCLDLTGVTPMGYHLIDTVMQSISLCDIVTLERGGSGFEITCTDKNIPVDESNLAHRAAVAFFTAAGISPFDLKIHIEKHIPSQAGLGGGSADAAAVLRGLDAMCKTDFGDKRLCGIGLNVGADVPFCLVGGCTRATGIGEILRPLSPLPFCKIVIIKPDEGVSTAMAYRRYDEYKGKAAAIDTDGMSEALKAGDLAQIGRRMHNVFEAVICGQTEPAKKLLYKHGAKGAVLSGSGSAVAGVFAATTDVSRCISEFDGFAREARPLGNGAVVISAK